MSLMYVIVYDFSKLNNILNVFLILYSTINSYTMRKDATIFSNHNVSKKLLMHFDTYM